MQHPTLVEALRALVKALEPLYGPIDYFTICKPFDYALPHQSKQTRHYLMVRRRIMARTERYARVRT